MFSRGNNRKNKPNEQLTSQEPPGKDAGSDISSREELLASSEDARRIFEDIQKLRQSVQDLRNDEIDIAADASLDADGTQGQSRTGFILPIRRRSRPQDRRYSIRRSVTPSVKESCRKRRREKSRRPRRPDWRRWKLRSAPPL